MKQRIARWYAEWLRRRIPPSREVTLDQRRIFIFPTAYGFFFLLVCVLLFLGGINYENNLIIGFSFLLTSLFVNAIMHTFRNLAGLTLAVGEMRPGFAGEQGALQLVIRSSRHAHRSLWLRWPEAALREATVEAFSEVRLWLDCPLPRRGRVRPGRLRIQTRYPLGLLRAWSLVDLDCWCLAWPRPMASQEAPAHGGEEEDTSDRHQRGSEDFEGLRGYVSGDSLRLVDWKSLARGRGLNTKLFTDPVEGRRWLDYDAMPGLDMESRLSRLCFWVLDADRRGAPYGLRLPGTELEPDVGPVQREQALNALALYGSADVQEVS